MAVNYKSYCGACGTAKEWFGNRWRCRPCNYKLTKHWYATSPNAGNVRKKCNSKPRSRYSQLTYLANRRKLAMEIPYEAFCELIQLPCHYCGDRINEQGSGLDRVDNSKGYLLTNVVTCCGLCNKVKRDYFTYMEMTQLGELIATIKANRKMVHTVENGG